MARKTSIVRSVPRTTVAIVPVDPEQALNLDDLATRESLELDEAARICFAGAMRQFVDNPAKQFELVLKMQRSQIMSNRARFESLRRTTV